MRRAFEPQSSLRSLSELGWKPQLGTEGNEGHKQGTCEKAWIPIDRWEVIVGEVKYGLTQRRKGESREGRESAATRGGVPKR